MKNAITQGLLLFALITTLGSCSNDEFFGAGWDREIVNTTINLDRTSAEQIYIGTLDLLDLAEQYMSQNYTGVKSYNLLEVRPTFGLVASTDVLPLGFVEAIDVYAISGNSEVLIGKMSSGSSQDASFGLSGVDSNLIDFARDETLDIALRPQYNDVGLGANVISVDISFAFSFLVEGIK